MFQIRRRGTSVAAVWMTLWVTLWLLTGLAVTTTANGQQVRTYSFSWRGASLQEVLDQLAAQTRISIVFSSDMASGRAVNCTRVDATPQDLLKCVVQSVGLDYVVSSAGTYIVIDSVSASTLFGHIAGRVLDDTSLTPLPDANIILEDSFTGTSTNENGLFSLSSLVSGWHDVTVTYVGYEPVRNRVLITPGSPLRIEFRMRRATTRIGTVVIDGLAQRLPSRSLGSDAALEHAGELGGTFTQDLTRGASQLPGIGALQPIAELHIQGSPSSEHLTLLDGAAVRDPVSLGRHLSAFSPLALGRVTVEKAGFGAASGSHLAGVVKVEQINHEGGPPAFAVQAAPASISGRATGAVEIGRSRLDLMATVRHSLWDIYRAPSVDDLLSSWNIVDPLIWRMWSAYRTPELSGSATDVAVVSREPDVQFSDMHFAGHLSTGRFSSLDFSGYRAANRIASDMLARLDLEAKNNVLARSHDAYDWSNWAGQMNYSTLVGSRSILTLKTTASRHESSIGYSAWIAEINDPATADEIRAVGHALRDSVDTEGAAYEGNAISEIEFSAHLDHSFTQALSVEGQLFVGWADARFRVSNQFVDPIRSAADANSVGGFVTATVAAGLHWQFEPGVRWTYIDNMRRSYAEPRLAARFDAAQKTWGSYAFRVAAGVYRQFTQQFDVSSGGPTAIVPSIRFWLPLDGTLAPPLANHLSAEFLALPNGDWTFRTEVYYKHQPRLLLVDYPAIRRIDTAPGPDTSNLLQDDFVSVGKGRAYGANFRAQYDGSLNATVSYGWSVAKRRFPGRFSEQEVTVPWNEPHRISASLTIPISTSFRATAAWQGAWGRSWSLRHTYYDYLSTYDEVDPEAVADFSTPDDDRGANYSQLDLTIAYDVAIDRGDLRFEIGVQNVLDRTNIYDFGVDPTGAQTDRIARTLPGRQPVFVLTAHF